MLTFSTSSAMTTLLSDELSVMSLVSAVVVDVSK